jgi:hypothetical protein
MFDEISSWLTHRKKKKHISMKVVPRILSIKKTIVPKPSKLEVQKKQATV